MESTVAEFHLKLRRHAPLSPSAMAASAEELQAEIEATRRRVEAERARRQELIAETSQAAERNRLRRQLEEMKTCLAEEQLENAYEAERRRSLDEDRTWWQHASDAAGSILSKQPVMRASGGNSINCAETVATGEYVWKIEGFSWLKCMLMQEEEDYVVASMPFQVGNETFFFSYSPWGDYLCDQHHGSLAILPDTKECVAIRYRISVKAWNGEFVQWGDKCDVVHRGDRNRSGAYGPDVHWPDHPPAFLGIFGLSHEELLQSEWVENDTLTVKFELEVRPYEYASSRPLSLTAEVPAPTMSEDTHALLEEGNCSDVQFMVQNEVIHAHSQVLCARSEVFSKQLTAGMQESVSKVVVIEDCDAATFKAFLHFLYTDQLPDAQELLPKGASSANETESGSPQLSRIQALLAVSHKYQVKRLQLWCEARLSEQIVKSQVCGILCQAHLLQARQLEMACLSFIRHHMSQVLMMPSYAELIRKWPQVALKVSLFSAGVSETEALAVIDAFEKPQELQWEEPTDSGEFLYQ